MFFPKYFGNLCTYDEDLVVSGAGLFTFDYSDGVFAVVDQGTADAGVLKLYDFRDPFIAPVLKSTTSLGANTKPTHPRIFEDHLYIPCWGSERTLLIYDISDLTGPSLLGSVVLSYASESGINNGPLFVEKIGNVACVTLGGFASTSVDAVKVDVSNPASPSVAATFNYDAAKPFYGEVRQYAGNFILGGTTTSGGVGFIHALDPSTFTLVGTRQTGTVGGRAVHRFSISDDGFLYAPLDASSRIWTVDVSNPASMVDHGEVSFLSGFTNNNCTLAVSDINRLYFGRGNGTSDKEIDIFDITTRSTPSLVGTISTDGEIVSDMARITDGCPGFAWGRGTGGALVRLLGSPPLS